ncbi:hypothetical protein C1H46_041908 [Malus baccata]|uniref:SCP domain-containing protein n=1 Tax=Malus baccata TaxID=106549 RepID=A0A540KF19_MALBA|nr:hypothetical protein C1H46_041908 [Malus baccata]
MGLCNISLAVLCSVVIQSSDSPLDYLNSHNAARAAVGVGPLTWDDTLAGYAQKYVNQRDRDCNIVHSSGPYGENLAMSTGDMSGTAACGPVGGGESRLQL